MYGKLSFDEKSTQSSLPYLLPPRGVELITIHTTRGHGRSTAQPTRTRKPVETEFWEPRTTQLLSSAGEQRSDHSSHIDANGLHRDGLCVHYVQSYTRVFGMLLTAQALHREMSTSRDQQAERSR